MSTLAEFDVVDEDEDTCPNGDPLCGGTEDLRAGELPCFACWFTADAAAIEAYREESA